MNDFKIGDEVFYDGDPKNKYIIIEIQKNENVMDVVFYRGYDSNGNFITRTRDSINKVVRWLINSDGYYPYCSNCKKEPESRIMTNFCPSCGADMRGE